MAAGSTALERISELESENRRHDREIERLREKQHKTDNILTAHNLIIKIACAASGIAGTAIGAALVKIITG